MHNSAALITCFVSNSFLFVIRHGDAHARGHGPSNSTHTASHTIYATALKAVTPTAPLSQTISDVTTHRVGRSHPISSTNPRRVDFLRLTHTPDFTLSRGHGVSALTRCTRYLSERLLSVLHVSTPGPQSVPPSASDTRSITRPSGPHACGASESQSVSPGHGCELTPVAKQFLSQTHPV